MSKLPVIAIFDVGKTNKKRLLFNQQYQVISEESVQFEETTDEDGFPCDDLNRLTSWIRESFDALLADKRIEIKAVNFSGYGASFVYIDNIGNPIPPTSIRLNRSSFWCLILYNCMPELRFPNTGEAVSRLNTVSPPYFL